MLVILAVMASVAAGCSASPSATARSATSEAPLPAGNTPSQIAKMVCQREARDDIASALGITATVSNPTWIGHLYSCRYSYPTGSMVLSLKELSSLPQTNAYYQMLATTLGKSRDLQGLGQGAFQTADGSLVLRKDWKVLLVDIAGLPAQFGVPPTSSGDVAVTVGDIIVGCWAGD